MTVFRFLADENFNNRVLERLEADPHIDIVRVQDIGLSGEPDDRILDWSALHDRILLTHDVSTMGAFALTRLAHGAGMPGLWEIPQSVSIGDAIRAVFLIVACGEPQEWNGQITHLPL